MATSTVTRYHQGNERSSRPCNTRPNVVQSSLTTTCPPSSFPDKFQDFFATLNEDADDLSNMLEDKLIPRKTDNTETKGNSRRWTKRTFQRRSSEIEVRLHRTSVSTNGQSDRMGIETGPKSPTPSRRRSSSIAVARPTPDLHRFLQTEAGPWGHLSPSPRSPTRPTSALSPGGTSSTSQHLSPSPTSPAGPGTISRTQRTDRQQHRGRTSSMPAVPRHRPMLAETKRSGITGCEDGETEDGVEYYRLRSFSITANGVFNLGDSLKSRRSRSINSVTSSGTSCSSTRDARLLSSASQHSCIESEDAENSGQVATYKVGMLGAAGVGKTALTAQFTTSEYICAYDASLDDEYGQKSVSVMIDGQEAELEIVDHPASEMAVESFCATYNPDVYVVVYSVVDRPSFKVAEEILLYLWESDYMATHGVILVGNKVDLERKREVTTLVGRRLANSCGCKFIETSSGLAHHVDELLVGILAQIKLNPQRDRDQVTRRRRSKHRRRILKHLLGFKRKTKSCENLFTL
ncbi:GTP-binding protein RAD-like isoform X1 [Microplitis mediator]|uniref:GTP-binding protein RAD-like isoform X1 n=1 Tax=Microplitis mediator TaxID=375433 RepID=UPI0025526F85|nr:GTP-binding protein RAD-like isoform X1 [Microplitis mediator]